MLHKYTKNRVQAYINLQSFENYLSETDKKQLHL